MLKQKFNQSFCMVEISKYAFFRVSRDSRFILIPVSYIIPRREMGPHHHPHVHSMGHVNNNNSNNNNSNNNNNNNNKQILMTYHGDIFWYWSCLKIVKLTLLAQYSNEAVQISTLMSAFRHCILTLLTCYR